VKRYRLIVNPAAGGGTAEKSIPRIERALGTLGVQYDIVHTQHPEHAIDLAQEAAHEGIDVVVAVGGDGTANEVLNGLMHAREADGKAPALGVLCVGRGNDFAYGAGVSADLDAACRDLYVDARRTIDIGRAEGGLFPEGRYFGNGVGVGFDAVVGFEAKKLKHLRGFAGYLVAALKTIFLYFKAPLVRVQTDSGGREVSALMVSVMNGRRLGGGFMMAPSASTDDGLFDVCIAQEVSKAKIFALIPKFMRGTQATHPTILTERTRSITVEAVRGTLPAHADGETLCTEGTRLRLEILPQRIDVVTHSGPEAK
jgi:diacylglycerol kinase (ATP)